MLDAELPIPLLVTVGNSGDGCLYLRFPLSYRAEVIELLDERGIDHGSVVELSAGTDLAIEAVKVLGSAGGLAALAAMINTFVRRHRDRKVLLDRGDIKEVSGFSARETERFLRLKAREQAEVDERWRRMLERMNEDRGD